MCTIIVALGVFPACPLVIAANRDEALDRPSSPPQLRPAGEFAQRRTLAPRDERAGGTWLGLNDAGLFVGITNRRARPERNRRSRGELVTLALGAADRSEALARIRALDAHDYNGFHLVVADRSGAQIIWGDGKALHEQSLEAGIHWITERSFDAAPSGRHDLLESLTADLDTAAAPAADRWRALLADHGHTRRGTPKQPRALSIGLDAMCVHARPLNYGTRSSTYVELGEAPTRARLLHAHGKPCETAWEDYAAPLANLLHVES